jgi:hypothetical protein
MRWWKMKFKDFNEWKTYTIAKLIELSKKYSEEGNDKAVSDINFLLGKLQPLRSRDLSSFLYYVHIAIRDTKLNELYDIIPSSDEVIQLMSKE